MFSRLFRLIGIMVHTYKSPPKVILWHRAVCFWKIGLSQSVFRTCSSLPIFYLKHKVITFSHRNLILLWCILSHHYSSCCPPSYFSWSQFLNIFDRHTLIWKRTSIWTVESTARFSELINKIFSEASWSCKCLEPPKTELVMNKERAASVVAHRICIRLQNKGIFWHGTFSYS